MPQSSSHRRPARIVTIIGSKGGIGKSSIAAHLLMSARLAGLGAVGVDLDSQRSLESWAIARAEEHREPAVRVATGRVPVWREMLAAESHAALAIVDTPPGVESEDQLAGLRELARASDLVLIPALPHAPSLRKIADFGAVLGRRQNTEVWFVLNCVIPGRSVLGEAREYLRQRGRLCEVEVPMRDHVHRAMDAGLTVVEDKRLGGHDAFRLLWEFAAGRLGIVAKAA
jgi:chromosome partitioning protein